MYPFGMYPVRFAGQCTGGWGDLHDETPRAREESPQGRGVAHGTWCRLVARHRLIIADFNLRGLFS